MEFRRVGGELYVKADAEFWSGAFEATEDSAARVAGKYVKVSKTGPLSELLKFTDLAAFAEDVLDPTGTLSKGDRKTIDGIEAIGLLDSGQRGEILYVALRGEPYLLELFGDGSGGTDGSLRLEYGKPVELVAPPADQVVDEPERVPQT